jgi:CheY-like chemotaxis protein
MAKELYGLKVLAVDDDADTRDLLHWVLEKAGADITVVSSAREALASIETNPPHVLVADIAMPD